MQAKPRAHARCINAAVHAFVSGVCIVINYLWGFSRFGYKHTLFLLFRNKNEMKKRMRDLKICFAPVKNILIKMFFSYKYLRLFWILVTQNAIIFGFHLYDIANRIFRFSHSTCFYFFRHLFFIQYHPCFRLLSKRSTYLGKTYMCI